MGGLQRDHTVNEGWTNHEGYSDGTAGAAINNIMRQQRRQTPPAPRKKPPDSHEGTTFIQVEHKRPVTKPRQGQPKQTPKAKAPLKTARTLYTICTMICRLQGFAIEAITLRDENNNTSWSKPDLDAPK